MSERRAAPADAPAGTVAFVGAAGREPRHRYALGALLDPLGLRLVDEGQPAVVRVSYRAGTQPAALPLERIHPRLLDDAFAALTLAGEAASTVDEYDRPLPPETPPASFAELTGLLARELSCAPDGGMRYSGGERFAVALTHDVDALGGGGFTAATRKALLGAALLPHSRDARRRRLEARAYVADARAGRDPKFPLDAILAAEQTLGWRSTFFFLVRRSDERDGIGRRYRARLAQTVSDCAASDLEVGLHASYRASEQPGAIAAETELFVRQTGLRPTGMRHHYLRSTPSRLAEELRAAGLEYDTSIGWATAPGARAGTPFPYRLWDVATGEAGGWELPLFVMDGTLNRYLGLDADGAYEAAVAALEPVAAAAGACAILWHPPNHHPVLASRYDVTYRRLLAWIAERGGVGGSARETLERWRRRVRVDGPARGASGHAPV